ncbi:PH domain-containing protein [Nonomuraea aurantiaca]|uniref:PH domain-containing protein n=1 Tax=Nonomuraea aurantiaca TaxID=2878562 RepID=UPI001CD920D2|nr:PH domain-containing protein [Nonomuraea aurantiaca]MCA2226826.1 PH domain-containing protein [Nonomuraea aurantiaca]
MSWRKLSSRSLAASSVLSLAIVAPAVTVLVRTLIGLDWPLGATAAAGAGAAVLIVAGVLAYAWARLRSTRWRLTTERLELRSGIAVRQHRSIPRDRVRSVDLTADPVRRVFGLTVVKVGTGEHPGEGTELTLDPLPRREAEALRRTLLRTGEVPLGDGGALAELRWAWIRYAPLSVWSFAGGALVLGALYKLLDAFGVNLFTTGTAAGAWGWVTARPWLAVPLLVAANVVVGVAGALLLFAESWGRYRLEREPGRLRLRRGLLTSRSLTLEERRLRGVEISEPLLLRLGGGARVKAVATGLRKAAENETEDVAALTPPLPRALAEQIAERVLGLGRPGTESPLAEPGQGATSPAMSPWRAGLVAHPAAARRRRVVRAVVAVAALAVPAAVPSLLWTWQGGWIWPAAVLVIGLPAGLWLAADAYRGLGHALGPRHLVTRRGSAARRTVALDRSGIVGWTVEQSFFQRRAGLLTLSATTAAGDGHYDVVDVGTGEGLDLAARAVPGLLEPFLAGKSSEPRISPGLPTPLYWTS